MMELSTLEDEEEEDDDDDDDEDEDNAEEIDLFGNKRRQSLTVDGAKRASLGLPDNGLGLTKQYYNIDRPMSITSLVDLIVMRRTGSLNRERRSTQLSQELEERIKETLAWKEIEDELNKEDVLVNFRKKMREKRKEARHSISKEAKTARRINEERRIQLRTSLLEPNTERKSTTESIKEAIHEFRMRQPAIIEEPQNLSNYEEDKETSDIIQKTRDLLEQLGYLKQKDITQTIQEEIEEPASSSLRVVNDISLTSSSSHSEQKKKKRKTVSQNELDNKPSVGNVRGVRARVPSATKSKTSFKSLSAKSRTDERLFDDIVVVPVATPSNVMPVRKTSLPPKRVSTDLRSSPSSAKSQRSSIASSSGTPRRSSQSRRPPAPLPSTLRRPPIARPGSSRQSEPIRRPSTSNKQATRL